MTSSIQANTINRLQLPIDEPRTERAQKTYLATAITFIFFNTLPLIVAHFKQPGSEAEVFVETLGTHLLIAESMMLTALLLNRKKIQLKASPRAISYTLATSSIYACLSRIFQRTPPFKMFYSVQTDILFTAIIGVFNASQFLKRRRVAPDQELTPMQITSV